MPDTANASAAMQGINPQMNFAYEYSAVMTEHGRNDQELRANLRTKIEQIQICREEIKRLRNRLSAGTREKLEKLGVLMDMDLRTKDLESVLSRELQARDQVDAEVNSTEHRLSKAKEKKSTLDMKDKYTFQLQQRVHEELSASMRGYNEAYSTVMCEKMRCLEIWHSVHQNFLEMTAAIVDSQQKAMQAFAAVSVKFKRVKTARDQLSSELKNYKEETTREKEQMLMEQRDRKAHDEAKLQKYKDHLHRCLVNRDLKYETVLESKDHLVARLKEQIDNLHTVFRIMEAAGIHAGKEFETLIELRTNNPKHTLSEDTMKLVKAMPFETEYVYHLDKIQKQLSDYIFCMHEIDKKREILLRDRAILMGQDPMHPGIGPPPTYKDPNVNSTDR
ncbi:hypothetical protein RvY_16020 [Ramazzottius varieornatus]|uniref:Uncharacterized protein n=1 Tax=Ramazzottius varieornatus TaxID=947166 RepID=A0A1D1W3L2_RAMVA|nr:hypothetical protein RvY_16020 [Ramazzottius varieornatus]